MSKPAPRLLYRREASDYLATEHGLDIKPEKLAHWAVHGGGPNFRLLAGRAAPERVIPGARLIRIRRDETKEGKVDDMTTASPSKMARRQKAELCGSCGNHPRLSPISARIQ